jgi:transposase
MNAIKTWVAEATVITREFVICRAEAGKLTWQSAASVLGIGPRQLRRIRKRYKNKGQAGLRDGRKASGRRREIPPEERQKVIQLKKERYFDFSVRHFYEFATEHHSLKASYSWTLKTLQQAGLVEKQRKRGTYRRRRPRRPMRGLMLHLDGSTHAWLGPGRPEWDLNLVVDDADGRILFGRFVPEEGTMSTMEALWHVVTEHGCFEALYSDRGSHFLPKDQHHDGQVQRALKQLGIRHIAAHSPQARGRGERIFGTVQDRLIPELRLAVITD